MKLLKNFCKSIPVIAAFFLSAANQSWSLPVAKTTYFEMELIGGNWRYDYTAANRSNPFLDPLDFYDFLLFYDPSRTFLLISTPGGWSSISGAGFVDLFSENPGPPPAGNDIPPGASLSGFSFQFDYQAGNLSFEATFTNPSDPGNPILISGISSLAVPPSPIGEPTSLLLLATGLIWFSPKEALKSLP